LQEHKINKEITASQVMLIDEDGNQIGIIGISSALSRADNAELDLVEIAPRANPPVCKIIDYGKFKFDLKKNKKKQTKVSTKEIRIRPSIEPHDLNIKIRRARDFLQSKHKVALTCFFRGRQMQFRDQGMNLIRNMIEELSSVSKVENPCALSGNRAHALLSPK